MNQTTIEETLERLQKLPPIEKLSGKKRKFFREVGRALLTNQLDYLIGQKKWVMGVIMSASLLEFAGKIRLIWRYKGRVPKGKIFNFNFATTIMCLFTSRIIDHDTYKKMEHVRDVRNKLSHNMLIQFSVSMKNKANPHLERVIKEAIKVIEALL